MKRIALALLVLASAAISSASVPPEWKQRYDNLVGLIRSKNIKLFEASFAPDFVSVGAKGKITTRAEFIKEFEQAFRNTTSIDANIELKDVKPSGPNIKVGFEFHIALHSKKGTLKMTEIGVDTWSNKTGKWLTVKTMDSSFTSATAK